MIILSEADIATLLSPNQIIDAVEAAMVGYEKKDFKVPQRMQIDNGDNSLFCMPSFGSQYFGTKLVSVVPGNRNKGLPVTNGAMVLNDALTGLPVALLNATKLTALRTAALGALGVRYSTPENEKSIGLIGCGLQGIHQAAFACSVRKISNVYYLYKSAERSSMLESFVHQYHPNVNVESCRTTEELLRKTSIVIAATTSTYPVIEDHKDSIIGKHFISVGSYKPSMQEFPDTVYKLAGKLTIDSEFARHETGDIINPIKKRILKEENVFTLGKVILGERTINMNETTVYKSAGMALYDLFVAQAMVEKAIEQNRGIRIQF